MMDAVHRYEGTVNQVLGHGIMALFGVPLAHADHAVRACYAALGREFSYELLRAVAPWDEDTVQRGLHQLVEAEFLYQRGLPPQATYVFKHALIQDAAYQSLLRSTRQQSEPAVAAAGQAGGGLRAAGADLRLVHRGL
jgi:hypothetical protein